MDCENDKYKKVQENTSFTDLSKYDLNDTDKRVLLLKLQGIKQIEICKQLNRKEVTISKICNKPEFLKAYNELTAETSKTYIEKLIDAKLKATEKYISLIDGDNIPIVARVCENIIQFDKIILSENGEEDNKLEFNGFDNNS